MDLSEWLAGYKGVADYGFVAFNDLKSTKGEKAATEFFNKIDDNGGGVVLLDEWCDFIKKAEVAAGTPLGALLNEDETNQDTPLAQGRASANNATDSPDKKVTVKKGTEKKTTTAAAATAAKRPSAKVSVP
jgi:topoisomerase IA-like protein